MTTLAWPRATVRAMPAITLARLIRVGWIAGIAGAVVWWVLLLRLPASDFHYYYAADLDHLYEGRGFANGTNYSPVFFQLTAWLHAIPEPVAVGAWRAILLGLVVWMAGPLTLPMLLLLPVESEIASGNINLVIAAAVVAGFRYPAAWAFVFLTKLTPGIGVLWFAWRRQWRPFAIAVVATGVIASISFSLAPGLWVGWLDLLTQTAPAPAPFYWSFWQRLPIVLVFLVLAGPRRWPVAIVAMMALPVFYTTSPSMLVGVVALAIRRNR